MINYNYTGVFEAFSSDKTFNFYEQLHMYTYLCRYTYRMQDNLV